MYILTMSKRPELYLIAGIIVLFLVVIGEYIILQQVEFKKTLLSESKSQNTSSNPQQSPMCQSYINAIPNEEQKKYLADVSEGFVAYERGLIKNIENTITWKGKINKILVREVYNVRSCAPGDSSSCRDNQIPDISLIELINSKTKFTDVPFIVSGQNNSDTLFFFYDEQRKEFIETDFESVANVLHDFKGEVTVKRTTLFNPTRRIIHISQTNSNAY